MRRFRYRLTVVIAAAVLLAGALLAAITAIAVVVALRESLPPQGDPAAIAWVRSLVRDMLVWSFATWVPLGAVLAWWIGRRMADELEGTRTFAREQAWEQRPPRQTEGRIVEVRRLEEALSGYFADLRGELTAVLRSREEVLVLLNAVGEGILQLDADGRLVRLNPAAARLLHLPGEALGQPIETLIRYPELRAMLVRPAVRPQAESAEFEVEGRQLMVTRQPLRSADAREATIVLVVDLTPVRKLEEVRRDFVANVSHELKTPLTAIRGYAETLQDEGMGDDVRREFLAATLRNADRLQRIVDDLLDLSRIESGGWVPRLAAVDVPALAADAWTEFAGRAAEKDVAFEVEGLGAPPARADENGLRQVLSNLYDNALRHTPTGGRITVRVSAVEAGQAAEARSDGTVLVEVADTGTGIPRDALPRIFERFYRVDPSRSRAAGGTGLGLAIVKHIAESMGGGVVARSTLGKGTTIGVTLPAAAPAPALEQRT